MINIKVNFPKLYHKKKDFLQAVGFSGLVDFYRNFDNDNFEKQYFIEFKF